MAYQPKYAKKPTGTPASNRPKSDMPERRETPRQKKRSKAGWILFVLLGILVVPSSLWATGKLLHTMLGTVGRPKPVTVAKVGNLTIRADVDAYVGQRLTEAREALVSADKPVIPEKEVEPVRKRYWIEEGTLVAPEPDPSRFGESTDPVQLQAVLDEAKWLLGDDPVYFRPDGERYQDSTVNYYLDDSIFAVTWKEVHDGSVYTFSEVKVSDPSQFRRHLAGGEYGSEIQYLTTEMAASVNAVVASAGDFYRFRNFGTVVYEGVARRVEGTYAETCYIDRNGDMHFTYGGEVLTMADAQAYVEEHDINFSLAFGPVLVDNYEVMEHTWYGVGEITEGYARAALCQMAPLHYIVVAANTTGPYQDIPTVATFAKNIAATGCKTAYCLDGGQTATIVMNDQLINRPVYGQQRKISDIIYFATAVPEGG